VERLVSDYPNSRFHFLLLGTEYGVRSLSIQHEYLIQAVAGVGRCLAGTSGRVFDDHGQSLCAGLTGLLSASPPLAGELVLGSVPAR